MRPTVFSHGVASGDPFVNQVIIWTRVTTSTAEKVPVRWMVAYDPQMSRLVASGTTDTEADRDHTVHVDVTGLEPGVVYYYQFEAFGHSSAVGRTKTLPKQGTNHIRFAQVSCAKFNAGFFNAYANLARRDDLDFLLHLGDYIYEASNTPPSTQTPGADIGRPFDPLHECCTLEDYRRRYAQYHADVDVQTMHASLPMIATLDDHELADGAWREGAENHVPDRDGVWHERTMHALRARAEWLPIRHPDPDDPTRVYRHVSLGGLADLFLIDTRSRRDEPVPAPVMYDPTRSALGKAQRQWLEEAYQASTAPWRLLGNPSVLAPTWRETIPEDIRLALVTLKLINADGVGLDYDQWDGYPVERAWLLNLMRHHLLGNTVVLSGDIHVGMAIELKENVFDPDEEPLAVEFVNTSLTSQNLDDKLGWRARTESLAVERAVQEAMPHIQWCDFDSHGYNVIDVTPERVVAEWWACDTVLRRSQVEHCCVAWMVEAGKPRLCRVDS